jgi:hypothetical protein
MVGSHIVTITVSLANYPEVTPVEVHFTLTVINNCLLAQISNNSQSLNKMLYVPLTSDAPSKQVF